MQTTKSWMNYAKLRVSYASTGKGPIAPYVIDYSFNSVVSTGGGFALGVTVDSHHHFVGIKNVSAFPHIEIE